MDLGGVLMTTFQARKDPLLRGVSPTPSKIPVRSQRRPPLPTVKPSAVDQENQDPRRLGQKLSIQRPLADSAGPRLKATCQTEQSEKLVGSPQLRNPLEELRPSHGGQNVGPRPPPQTEGPGTIEFVADPAALATILSGEGVKSCRLGRQPSLAQRVLVRGSQGGTIRRGQDARASAYLAPRTPTHRLDPVRASCFSRLEGPGPRGRTLCPQRLEALELRRETSGSSKTSVSQALGSLLEQPVQPASSLPEGEPEVVTQSDEGGGGPLGLAQRVPLKETRDKTHTRDGCDSCLMPSPGQAVPPAITRPSPFGRAQRVPSPGPSAPVCICSYWGLGKGRTVWLGSLLVSICPCLATPISPQISYSVLRRLATRPKTQFTPLPSASRVQQARGLSGLSPQPCPEESALPWEQIAVRLFDQESGIRLQEGPGKPPVSTPYGPHPSRTPNFQELKMQRISILQQLLRQEVEGLAEGKCAPLNGSSSLDMVELQPLLAEISRTLNAPEKVPEAFHLPGLLQHPELPKPYFPEECGEPEPCPGAKPEVAPPCPPAEPGPPESCLGRRPEKPEPSTQEQPEASEPSPPVEPGPLQACPQGQVGLPEPSTTVDPGVSEACSLELRNPESSSQPRTSQWAPATTSLTFSSQRPLCASPRIRSLQSLKLSPGPTGPSHPAPRTMALRQRLKACLTAIHGFHEACLDDECAFYTSRAPPSGLTRVCTNPVAMMLEWQDALCFIPVGSAAPQDSPS
ncbi:tastin isoform X3 [Cervus elaphus]|uniref:tastin isoform X3 n=1 Tax=Cervus canadensis TaxID=1574408 RepID=UPI001CA30837|nr:tastin isoform X3 [Cervus canadensis]XP_043740742.1 tastin isoform X3 [Cervus elaphus]